MDAAEKIIRQLGLEPHPEGGHFRETWRASSPSGERAAGTAIYYLLREGEQSHWHRVDAAEIWHWYAGSPLELSLSPDGNTLERHVLGNRLDSGEAPQAIVPENCWQSARSLGAWTLVGCTVSPAFEFAGFEMAPDGWQPRNG